MVKTPETGATPPKDKAKASGHIVIHGHFYQPPRENPWIEKIEEEVSALPFHDWNERIAQECYTTNSCARIYDGGSIIADIVNNYDKISFNFGPTLLSWLQEHAPLTYQRILAADRVSLARLKHGNAIAQAYNHVILPLANPRDLETEVIWGLADFEHRFGRKAEAMWLPETAANYATLAVLAAHGMKYVILSPYQARRVKALEGGVWEMVQAQTLDTTQAYRCFLPGPAGGDDEKKYLDVFFYDGGVASDLSFGNLLNESKFLVDRLEAGYRPDLPRPQLINVATDGENYGHHHKFGELGLAYALNVLIPRGNFSLTNYAAFLEMAPPKMRVELEVGPKGEGSSWSCAHGVGRWKEDCGCSTGGLGTWNQRWRAPLREAFDFLSDRLARVFEVEGARYFKDPWAARNGYINIILDRREENIHQFFSRYGVKGLTPKDWYQPLRLLEMERHTLLMYTSCGWFFADLAGLETIQVMKYAARALQLGQRYLAASLEEPFLKILEKGKSNIDLEGDGRQIFTRHVKPAVADYPKVANQWAVSWLKDRERLCPSHIYHFQVRPQDHEVHTQGTLELAAGSLQITSGITRWQENLNFFTVHLGSYLYRTQILEANSPEEFQQLKQDFFRVLAETPEDLIPLLASRLGDRYYTVHDIFQEEKEQIFADLLAENRTGALNDVGRHFDDAVPILKAIAAEKLPFPRLYQALGEITLDRRLVQILRRVEAEPEVLPASEGMLELLQEAVIFGFKLESREGGQILLRILNHHLMDLAASFDQATADSLEAFLKLQRRIPITWEPTEAQNFFFSLMKEHFAPLAARAGRDPKVRKLAETLVSIADALDFNPAMYQLLLD